jgi:hypothetical protein
MIMGRTREISYGLTYGFMDQLDFFVEEVKDGKYRKGNEYVEFRRRFETIRVKDGSSLELLFLESQDGLRTLELPSHKVSDVLASDGTYPHHHHHHHRHYHHHHHAHHHHHHHHFIIIYPVMNKVMIMTR